MKKKAKKKAPSKMPVITRIVAGVRNKDRANIYLDGAFAFALSIDEVYKHSLTKGVELTGKDIANLKSTDTTKKLYSKAIYFLSFRPRSEKEVRDRLKEYDCTDPSIVELLINRLKSNNYIDDEKFATVWVASRRDKKSSRVLLMELSRLGIDKDLASQVVGETKDQEGSVLSELIEKKTKGIIPIAPKEKSKLLRYLVGKGFDYEKIKSVLRDLHENQ